MTASPSSRPLSRRLQYAVLGVAIVAALGIGAFVFLSGGEKKAAPPEGGAATTPAQAAERVYTAVAAGYSDYLSLVAPEVKEAPGPLRLAFPGADFVPDMDDEVTIVTLAVQPLSEQSGWASVRVTGRYRVAGSETERLFDGPIYLHDVGGAWLVSSAMEFQRSMGTAPTAAAGRNPNLGSLDPYRPKVGEPAPDFALLDARDGVTVRKLSDFRGKAVVLNWYASWCGPCKAEIPEFQAAYAALGDELVVLGVDYAEERDRAQGILDIFAAKYPAVLDSEGKLADHWRVGAGLPTTFFIDKDGILRGSQVGQVRVKDLVEQLAKVGVTYTPK
jgi:cytochrome c biogenesis protein CcmG, thiol:disulfide interchange protein DsbE